MEIGEPQRRMFTAIGTTDGSYSLQLKGEPAQGQLATYDAILERWIPQSGSISSTIKVESAFESASFVDQDPSGLGFEIIRDTDGNNSGGLRAGLPNISWNPSPSALLIITRFAAVS